MIHPPLPVAIAVVGSGASDSAMKPVAETVGRALARAGVTLVCGGRGGVMAAAARGARQAGGRTVGILPGTGPDDSPPNPSIEVPIFTGMGQARNLAVVLSADVVIAIGGGWGTLSEIGLARKHGRPVVLLGNWHLELPDKVDDRNLVHAKSPEEAVEIALDLARDGPRR